jgi:hypothetical protein
VVFFGSSHGKGEHDGACVIAKREFQKEQLRLNATLKCPRCNEVLERCFCKGIH